jgi:ATP-binding cassette subfamily B protein
MQTIRGLIGVWVGSKLMGDLRKDVYQSLMRLSLSYFDRRQTSQFIGRVNSDAEAMRQFMTDGVTYLSGEVLRIVAIFIIIFSLDWKLSLFALLPVPVMIIVSMTIWPKIDRRWYQQWRSIFRLNTLVGDSLQGRRLAEKARRRLVIRKLTLWLYAITFGWRGCGSSSFRYLALSRALERS